MNAIVTGSSGFIGGHLVKRLRDEGYFVIGIDIVEPEYNKPNLFFNRDLRIQAHCKEVFQYWQLRDGIDEVYNLACLMGGMGFIGNPKHSYDVMVGSSQIVANVIESSTECGVKKSFYSSSACVYNQSYQQTDGNNSLSEDMAYPANPDLVYGWQKLFSEQMYQASKLDIKIARFHNIFGPEGTWRGGKEKAPAAICRKVANALGDSIEIWGDGKQTRSFLYVDECIEGVMRLMNSDFTGPVNIGSDEMVSINELVYLVAGIAGKAIRINHIDGPTGVRGRNSNNDLIFEKLAWKPSQPLSVGLEKTYRWIEQQIQKDYGL